MKNLPGLSYFLFVFMALVIKTYFSSFVRVCVAFVLFINLLTFRFSEEFQKIEVPLTNRARPICC